MTYCSECDNVQNPKDHWARWLCVKFPRLVEAGFVTKEYRETDLYMRCKDINGGSCPMFKPKATNQINIPLGE